MILDVNEIQKLLPHRYPFLMIDGILEIERLKSIVGVKNVTINEHFFQGHFPGKPIMPGVLIIEAMAQTGGLLLLLAQDAAGIRRESRDDLDQKLAGEDDEALIGLELGEQGDAGFARPRGDLGES